jgi:hypothetical protein
MWRVQESQLLEDEEQKDNHRADRIEQVLSVLPQAPAA